MRPIARISCRSALPVGVAFVLLIGLQATLGLIPLRNDPTARLLGVGWRELAADIEATRARLGARCVIGANYGVVSWLAFYLPPGTCVAQINESIRWANVPEPSAAMFADKVLFVGDGNIDPSGLLRRFYTRVASQGTISRKRGDQPIETYRVDLVEGLKGDPFDRALPPELQP